MNQRQGLLIFSICILALALVFTACDLGMYDSAEKEAYRIGYNGLEYSIVEFPKTDVYENDIFSMQVDLHNKGAYNADEARLVVGATSPLILEDGKPVREFKDIGGRSDYNPGGGYIPTPEIFTFKAGPIAFATEELAVDVPINLCYSYQTVADLVGCVGARVGAFTCEFEKANQKLNLSAGQGAPLAVTDVEEIITNVPNNKVKLTFLITIENKGPGQVFKHATYDDTSTLDQVCGPRGFQKGVLNYFDYSVQLSEEYRFDSETGNKGMECVGSTHLEENRAKIKCEVVDLPRKPATRSPLKIVLDYAYKTGETKQVTIRKIIVD